jgi:hypothetical protein
MVPIGLEAAFVADAVAGVGFATAGKLPVVVYCGVLLLLA